MCFQHAQRGQPTACAPALQIEARGLQGQRGQSRKYHGCKMQAEGQDYYDLNEDSRAEQLRHAELLRKYETQKRTKSIYVPTSIAEVPLRYLFNVIPSIFILPLIVSNKIGQDPIARARATNYFVWRGPSR